MGMPLTEHRFTVDEYHRMGEAGIFHEDDRVELIRGRIVQMSPIGRRHAGCVKYLGNTLIRLLGPRAVIGIQDPVITDAEGEPQPDVAVLAPRPGFYRDRHPAPADILLLIEVADTSLDYDRGEKLPLYAEAGVREVWLVNLPGDAIEVYRDPRDGRYADVRTARRGETIAPLAFPDLTLAVSEILG
jgi:Uma2 family endonuclease